MADLITFAVVLLIVAAAVTYIVKEKKKGNVCIGCSSAATCPHAKKGGCPGSCGGHATRES